MKKRIYDMQNAFYAPAIPLPNTDIFTKSFLIETGEHRFHYHDTLEIGICLEGEGTLYTDYGIYPFHAGDAQIICPFIPHISISAPDSGSRWMFMALHMEHLVQKSNLSLPVDMYDIIINGVGFNGILSVEDHKDITSRIQMLVTDYISEDKHTETIYLLDILSLLLRIKQLNLQVYIPGKAYSAFQKILPALKYLANNTYTIKLTTSDLAHMCCVSETYFRSLFKEVTGYSPKKYVQRGVIGTAEFMLRNTYNSIESISDILGFSDPSGFYRMFTSYTGMSPTVFRGRNSSMTGKE